MAPTLRQILIRVIGYFPVMTLRILKVTGVTAPENLHRWFDKLGTCGYSLTKNSINF